VTNVDEDILDNLRDAAAKQRPWANFFWWHDRSEEGKALAECSAARDLFASLQQAGRGFYSDPNPSGDQWPDCVAHRSDDAIVAVEVTELVDYRTLHARTPPQPWATEKLRETIQNRISEKDGKSFHGGKYAEVILLIHTDEFYLHPTQTIALLRDQAFALPHGNLTRVFILFSYWPEVGHCPAAELTITR
jgi:hypothetical protein